MSQLRPPVVVPPEPTVDLKNCEYMRCQMCRDGYEGDTDKLCPYCNGDQWVNTEDYKSSDIKTITGPARLWWLTLRCRT